MIYLYTLPGTAFNMPQISVPLLKGYLKECKIKSKQYDLTSRFLEICFKNKYIKEMCLQYYHSLNKNEKNIVDNIEKTVKQMQDKSIDTLKIVEANEQIYKYLEIIGRHYGIKWERRGIDFSKKILKVDDVIELAYSEENSIFDKVLKNNHNLNDNDIIYLSVQYPFQLCYAIRFSMYLKSKNSSIKIILGGDYITHINKNLKEIMEKCFYIDGIALFGNYNNVVEMIKIFQNKKVTSINNVIYRNEDKIVYKINKQKDCFYKDKYVPDFSDLNLDNYLSNLKLVPFTLNYGCYHSKCMFCSRYYYYNGYHTYDINKIFAYLKELYNTEHIEAVYFVDECILPDILMKLATYLIDNDINIKWMVETRIDRKYIEKNFPKILYNSGCREISFGVESYNKKILRDMNKEIDLSIAKKTMKNFYNSGISVSATFMIGYPTENILNIKKTLKFIRKFKYLDTFGLSIFNYMRNSKLVDLSCLNEEQDLNLIYRTTNDNYYKYMSIINKFNNIKKIKQFVNKRSKILYRSEYMYLDRKYYSLNYKGDVSMGIKSLLKKIDKKDLKSKIYLKELKPEMTQCRIIQVDNKIKEKIK